MSSTVTVNAGPAVRIGSGLKGAVLYNNDSTNTVWVGSGVNTSPTNGIPIGPLGHATWQTDGLVFASIGTGPASVDITVTLDISTLDNPVAIAAAAASLLLAQGIPAILIQDTLYNGGFTNLPPGNDTGWLLVSKYSSLILQTDISVNNKQFTYSFSNDGVVTSYTDSFTGVNNQGIPVRGKWFKVHSNINTAAHLIVLGTNRQISTAHDQIFSSTNLPAIYALASQTYAAGSINQFPSPGTRNPTGLCYLSGSLTTGTAARGIINYSYIDDQFNAQSFPLTDTGEWHLDNPAGALFIEQKPVMLPNMAGFNLNFQCRVAGTTVVTITLVSDVT